MSRLLAWLCSRLDPSAHRRRMERARARAAVHGSQNWLAYLDDDEDEGYD